MGGLYSESTLSEFSFGDVISVEFDRTVAPIGKLIAESDAASFESDLVRPFVDSNRLDGDFSEANFVVDFIVGTASGVAASVILDVIKGIVRSTSRREGVEVDVRVLSRSPGDTSVRLRVSVSGEESAASAVPDRDENDAADHLE